MSFSIAMTPKFQSPARLPLACVMLGALSSQCWQAVRADTPQIVLSKLLPRKLLYNPGEAAFIDAVISNNSAREATVTLEVQLIRDFTPLAQLKPLTVTLKAGETRPVELPFTASQQQYGEAAVGVLKEGDKQLDTRTDVFNVSDNVFKVGVGANLGMQQPSGYKWLQPEDDVKKARAGYMNFWEKFFWAPCDWADLAPKTPEWVSGQTGRHEVGAKISGLIKLLKENGIRSITYDTHVASGPPGWEVERRHPDWFFLDQLGRPGGEWHQNDLLHWNNIAEYDNKYGGDTAKWPYKFNTPGYKWMVLYPDYSRTDVINYGSDRIIEGADMWGWDGVRFDGQWSAGNDEMCTRNMQMMKGRIWAKYPNFLFGYNDENPGKQPEFAASHEFRERMAGFGESMNEMIRGWGGHDHGTPFTYTKWSDYAAGVLGDVVANRKEGGTQYVILDSRKHYYKLMLAFAAGAHDCYGDQWESAGSLNWGRFLTRWSGLIYDTHLQQVDSRGKAGVKADGALWWDKWVTERIAGPDHMQRIVSLIVPPANDDVQKDERGPTIKNAKVAAKVAGAGKLSGVYLLDPEVGDEPVKLESTLEGDWASVVVPQVTGWSMVVFDFTGQYAVPHDGPRTTEPFDPKKVEEAYKLTRRPASKDPIRPEEDPTRSGTSLVREAETLGLFVPGPTVVADPDASGGAARRMDANTANSSSCFGHNPYSGMAPGRYRATYRIKIEDKTKFTGMGLMYSFGKKEAFPIEVNPDSFKQSNVYQDFSFEFDYDSNQQLWISGFFSGNKRPGALYVDKVTLELLKPFTDSDLEARRQAGPLPEDLMPGTVLPATAVAPGAKVELPRDPDAPKEDAGAPAPVGAAPAIKLTSHALVVNGLHSEFYHLGAALPADWTVTEAFTGQHEAQGPYMTEFPSDPDQLFQNRVVVLSNVDATALGYENRRLLRLFVQRGGGLLLLGGVQTLGQGGYKGTFLDELLPVNIAPARDIQKADKPLPLKAETTEITGAVPAASWREPAFVYWRHRVEAKPEAKVQVNGGTEPLLVTGQYGKGRVAVFAGTVLGESQTGAPPFWNWSGWTPLVQNTVLWLAGGNTAHFSTVDAGEKLPLSASHASSLWMCKLSDGAYKDVEQEVMDGSLTTGARRTGDALGIPGSFLQFDLGGPTKLTQVKLASLAERGMISPPDAKGWGQPGGPTLLRGSSDGKTWTTLLTLPTIGETEKADWHTFKIKDDSSYRYVQIYGGNFQVSEVEVWGSPAH